jgi:hypothetical protein
VLPIGPCPPERRGNGETEIGMGTAFFPDVPRNVLLRHGARTLDPVAGVVTLNGADPRPTVYRTATLIGPPGLDHGTDQAIVGDALRTVGLRLDPYGTQQLRGTGSGTSDSPAVGHDLFSYTLQAASVGTVPDAWIALQALRAPGSARVGTLGAQTQLDHLMFGATVVLDGAPGPIQGVGGNGPFASYTNRYGSRPIPVSLLAPPPDRGAPVAVGDPVRRPVVAVLDSGVGPHHWWGRPWAESITGADPFLFVAGDIQGRIRKLQESGQRPVFDDARDGPYTAQPLIGELEPFVGHGTFIAGIVRQVAPRARVLAVRVMHTDGIVHEADLVCALDGILGRVVEAQENNRPELMVDVVSLSMGYFDEDDAVDAESSAIARVIEDLAARGVPVIAAAGNQGTDRPFFPAAMSVLPGTGLRVAGVGALNPPGTRALFSNDGAWVTRWRHGSGIVSAMPTDLQGSRSSDLQPQRDTALMPPRESFDCDDFRSGFGLWNGSSFATPIVAAQYLNELITEAQREPGGPGLLLSRSDTGQERTVRRATAALRRLAVLDPPYVHQ